MSLNLKDKMEGKSIVLIAVGIIKERVEVKKIRGLR